MKKIAISLSVFLLVVFGVSLSFANSSGVLMPSSSGTYATWTPSTGTTHYTLVDESSCNGTTDYVSTNTVGNRDSYGVSLSGIPDKAKITAIDIKPCASRNSTGGSGSATLNVFYRLNGANSADQGAYALSGTTPVELATTTFSGLSVIKNGSTTLEVGAIYSAGTKGARLSRIATTITFTPVPNAPSGASLSADLFYNKLTLTWTDNSSDELGFKVERSTDNVNFTQISTTTLATYTDSSLTSGNTYYYRVAAYNSAGNSDYSNTTSYDVPLVPLAPTNATSTFITGTSTSQIYVSWQDPAINEQGYQLEESTDNVNFAQIATTTQYIRYFYDNSFAPATTYYYRVRSYNVNGSSAYSNTTSVTTP